MNTDKPLTREDVERLLQEAGSSTKLVLQGRNLGNIDLSGLDLSEVTPGNFVANLFRGRINRRSYIVGYLASYSAFLVTILIFSHIPINTDLAAIVSVLVLLLVWVVVVLFSISLMIRRFHDFNKGGSSILWLLVPFINVYFGLLLLFEEGTVGPNRYGPPSRPSIHLFSDPTQERQHHAPPHA